MTDRGIMVVDQDQAEVEPIIPVCCMVKKLGYTVTWMQSGMKLSHPSKDEIQVEMRHGCPADAEENSDEDHRRPGEGTQPESDPEDHQR